MYDQVARLYKAGIKYGMSPNEVFSILNDAGIGKSYLIQIEQFGEVRNFPTPRGTPFIEGD